MKTNTTTTLAAFFFVIQLSTTIAEVIHSPELEVTVLGSELEDIGLAWGNCSPDAEGGYSDNTYALAGNGVGVYWCWDRAAFAHLKAPVAGDFLFTARLSKSPDIGIDQNGKIGLVIKGSLTTHSPVLSLRWDYYWQAINGGHGLTWFNRQTPEDKICLRGWGNGKSLAKTTLSSYAGCDVGLGQMREGRIRGHNFCGARRFDPFGCFEGCLDQGYENRIPDFTSREDLWMRIRKKEGTYDLFAKYGSEDTWTKVSSVTSLLGNHGFLIPGEPDSGVYVGVSTSGAPQTCTRLEAEFDNIELRTGMDSHIAFDWIEGAPGLPITTADSAFIRRSHSYMELWGAAEPTSDVDPAEYGIEWPLMDGFVWKKIERSQYTILSQVSPDDVWVTNWSPGNRQGLWSQGDLFIYEGNPDPYELAYKEGKDFKELSRIVNKANYIPHSDLILEPEFGYRDCNPCTSTFAGSEAFLHNFVMTGEPAEHGSWYNQSTQSFYFRRGNTTYRFRIYVDGATRNSHPDLFEQIKSGITFTSAAISNHPTPGRGALTTWFIERNDKEGLQLRLTAGTHVHGFLRIYDSKGRLLGKRAVSQATGTRTVSVQFRNRRAPGMHIAEFTTKDGQRSVLPIPPIAD